MRSADHQPALIAQCADEHDVIRALQYASNSEIPVAVRGGGHGVDGTAMPAGALVIDLSALKGISVDPAARVANVQADVLLREMDAATQQHGLATPAGTVGTIGIAGLTLGGGVGYLMRRFGATAHPDDLFKCIRNFSDSGSVRSRRTAFASKWKWEAEARTEIENFRSAPARYACTGPLGRITASDAKHS